MMMPSALIHIPLYHRDENTIGAAGGILITIQSIIALATAVNEILYVRNVNTFLCGWCILCAYIWVIKQNEADRSKSNGCTCRRVVYRTWKRC